MTDDADLDRAVERFGGTLEALGMPRMASRMFAFVLADDRIEYTAGELAAGLRISPAAVSGAASYLVASRLVSRERRPGRRGDVFRVHDGDIWATIMTARMSAVTHFIAAVDDAAEMLPPGSPGRGRLEETSEFFAFVDREFAGMLERWQAARRHHG
ncbi:MAG: GbsR/MarR family transcriptional regulator [Dermatophilaceae bacterium]